MVAVLYTKTYGRIIAPGRTAMDRDLPDELALRSPLATGKLSREIAGKLPIFCVEDGLTSRAR
jgi:hypothetical protein